MLKYLNVMRVLSRGLERERVGGGERERERRETRVERDYVYNIIRNEYTR